MSTVGKKLVDLAGGPLGRIKFVVYSSGALFAVVFLNEVFNRYLDLEHHGLSALDVEGFLAITWIVYYIICCARRTSHIGWPVVVSVLAWLPIFNIVFLPAMLITPGAGEPWIAKESMIYRISAKVRK